MSLNIKNEKTCELARELAELTNDTMTGAVTVALIEKIDDVKRRRERDQLRNELRAIRERCATLVGPGPSAVEHGDFLYDDHGLPK